MDSSLSAIFKLYVFPTGRRLFALAQLMSRAKDRDFPELVKHCSGALAHDRGCLALERRWAGLVAESKGKAPTVPVADDGLDATQIDPLVDNTLTAIRDHAISQTAGASPDDPIHATVSGLLREIYPTGVQNVTSLAFVLELAAVDDILAKLQGKELAPVVKELGLGRLVKRLAELAERYRAALAAPAPETLEFGNVRAARAKGQDLLLEAIALVLGRHHSSSPDDVAGRADLLGPILEQNAEIAAAFRGRRTIVDVNPETGQLDPKAPGDAAPAEPTSPGEAPQGGPPKDGG